MKALFYSIISCVMLFQTICFSSQKPDADSPDANEAMAMIVNYHLAKQPPSLAYQAVAVQEMLKEANLFAERLKLPSPYPIQINDVKYPLVFSPWYSIVKESVFPYRPITVFSNRLFDSSIPREQRAQSLKFGVSGGFETTNAAFGFGQGRLTDIERLSEHEVEYFANDLDKLIGKQSLINDAQAHQLATQWLASVDVDVSALERKYPPEINRLRVLPKNSTNVVALPFYFVHWGKQYFTNGDDNHTVSSTPLVQVKILGTTKELVSLHMTDTSFSRRPLLLITNALELIRVGSPSIKRLGVPVSEKSITNTISQP